MQKAMLLGLQLTFSVHTLLHFLPVGGDQAILKVCMYKVIKKFHPVTHFGVMSLGHC